MMLEINPIHPQSHQIVKVAASMKTGGVIAYPTDTTYGIGCSIFCKKSIERIYQMKVRDRRKPFSIICSSLSEISRYARVSTVAFKIIKRYLPGPYTFIFEATREVPDLLLTRQKTVGIRIPDNPICTALVTALGNPIITTSANLTGEDPQGDPRVIEDVFGNQLEYVIDGGLLATDVSSVVSLINDVPEVLRVGIGDVAWCSQYAGSGR